MTGLDLLGRDKLELDVIQEFAKSKQEVLGASSARETGANTPSSLEESKL